MRTIKSDANTIVCPECGGDTQTKDSRPIADRTITRRRRSCLACKHRFTTFETLAKRQVADTKDLSLMLRDARDIVLRLEALIEAATAHERVRGLRRDDTASVLSELESA